MAVSRKARLKALSVLKNFCRTLPVLVWLLKFDLTDDGARRTASAAALVSALLFLWASFRLNQLIVAKGDNRLVHEKEKEAKTVQAYDEEALGMLFSQATLQYGVVLASVRYFRLSPPLAFIVTIPLTLVQHPLFQVHFLGADDADEGFERPWEAAASPVAALEGMQADLASRQKAAEERAKKMNNGIVKKPSKEERKRK